MPTPIRSPLSLVWPSLSTILFLLSAPGAVALTYGLLRERRQAAVPSPWLWVAGMPIVANALFQFAFYGPAGLSFLFSG